MLAPMCADERWKHEEVFVVHLLWSGKEHPAPTSNNGVSLLLLEHRSTG